MNQINQNNLKTIFLLFSCFYFLTTNSQTLTTLAGSAQGYADGTGTATQFYYPAGVAVANDGTVFVAEQGNHRIRKITAAGVVTTIAGSSYGFSDGTGTAAQFFGPTGLAIDAAGNLFVADRENNRIRKITVAGVVTTLAGSGGIGAYVNGTGTVAKFNSPQGVAVDADGNVFVADKDNNRIRKITAAGVVTTLAGSTQGFADGTGTAAKFANPTGVAVDANGNVYVADTWNNRIRKITSSGVVTTLAGSGTTGTTNGTGTSAKFSGPQGVSIDAAGNIFVADTSNYLIRKISAAGVVTTLAGSTGGFADGIGTSAKFNLSFGLTVAADGTIFVADTYNNRIRKITDALATANFQLENYVSLYPNPASTFINLELGNITASKVTILDMNGRILQSENILDDKTAINISNLVSGIYLTQITTDKGTVSKKIVKQ